VAHWAQKSHGDQHQIGIHRELASGNRCKLRGRANPYGMKLFDIAIVVASEASCGNAPVANSSLFVRGFRT
jgi:hypothetical protein